MKRKSRRSQKGKKARLEAINFQTNQPDPIVENLTEAPKEEQNIDDHILDQIALEGLTGITFGRLLRILSRLCPNYKPLQDEKVQHYVWAVVVEQYLKERPGSGVRAFHLVKAQTRAKQSQDDDSAINKSVIIDKEVKLPNETSKRIMIVGPSLFPVQDGQIMGSCDRYLERKNITEDIIEKFDQLGCSESMYEIHKQYNFDQVYLVADQEVRWKALFPNYIDPNINIKLREYTCLELIGRSRTLGCVFPNNKTLGRYRIMLMAKGVITQYQKTCQEYIKHHLKRFSVGNTLFDMNAFNTKGVLRSDNKVDNENDNDDDNDDDEEDYEGYQNHGKQLARRVCCDPNRLRIDRDFMTMVYDIIAKSSGKTNVDLRKQTRLPRSHIRNHLKNLLAIDMIRAYFNDNDKSERIFKSVHKSLRRKKRDRITQPTGIMSKWDATDLRAKNILGHKRSSFSQAEDSLLIVCRIVSLLIEPNLKKLNWCVHKRVVRDILHEELVESHDKTSDACSRRVQYLRRLPNNIMSINELTAELRDDPDIMRLIESRPSGTGERLEKHFTQILGAVRAKLPYLLGLSSPINFRRNECHKIPPGFEQNEVREKVIRFKDHKELKEKYELIDCQSVASLPRSRTFDPPKNLVDVKLNQVCLVTLASTLTNCFSSLGAASQRRAQVDDNDNDSAQTTTNTDTADLLTNKRASLWLLDKFYSNYQDKLVSSVMSKLNRRSLLTRKCPLDQTSLYRPFKYKISLKLNQSVLFLLNRHHSSSLIQLANPISSEYKIELSESNEMTSIALLTSFCSQSSFNLDLRLKIPVNSVGIDQGNENFEALIVYPCNVRFYSDRGVQLKKTPMQEFLDKSKPIDASLNTNSGSGTQTNWLIKSFQLTTTREQNYDVNKIPIEFEARLWKSIDGNVHIETLLKLIESVLSWITVFPGAELELLENEFCHLMPDEHLLELLELMENLELISSTRLDVSSNIEPRLFGYATEELGGSSRADKQVDSIITYEPKPKAFIQYCHLLDQYCR